MRVWSLKVSRVRAEGWQAWPEGSVAPQDYFVAVLTGFIQLKWPGYYKCACPGL